MSALPRTPKPVGVVGASSEGLVRAVMAVCAAALDGVGVPNAAGAVDAIRVVRNMFDPDDHETPNLPSVTVQYAGGGLSEEQDNPRTTKVDIKFEFEQAAYGDDELGVAVMDMLMTALASTRLIDGGNYRLRLPLTWEPNEFEEQPTWPNWSATLHAEYYVPTIADTSIADLI